DGNLAFDHVSTAIRFLEYMCMAGEQLYRDPVDLYRHWALAEILRNSLEREELTLADLDTTDHAVMLRIWRSRRARDHICASLFAPPRLLRNVSRDGMYSCMRFRDPHVKIASDRSEPLSNLSKTWSQLRRRAERAAATPSPRLRLV